MCALACIVRSRGELLGPRWPARTRWRSSNCTTMMGSRRESRQPASRIGRGNVSLRRESVPAGAAARRRSACRGAGASEAQARRREAAAKCREISLVYSPCRADHARFPPLRSGEVGRAPSLAAGGGEDASRMGTITVAVACEPTSVEAVARPHPTFPAKGEGVTTSRGTPRPCRIPDARGCGSGASSRRDCRPRTRSRRFPAGSSAPCR